MSRLTSRPNPLKPCYQHFPIDPALQHMHMTAINHYQLQDANIPLEIQCKLHTMLTSTFTGIMSKSPTGPPVSTKPYIIPLKYQAFIDDEIKLLKDAGCISKSLSDWASLICIVKKKPDPSQPNKPQLHMYINYRKVNQSLITACNNSKSKVVSSFPLPKIQELLSYLNKCKYFSSLYLSSGYCHISLTEEAKKKTAFVTADGKYQWNVVPFSLATAVSTFQYLMSTVLTGLKNFAFTYLDDVLVFSETYNDHLLHLNVVFKKFQNLVLKLSSVNISFSKLTYIT